MNGADNKAGCFEDRFPGLITAEDQKENAAALQALNIALVGDSQPTHLSQNQKAGPSFINVYSHASSNLEDPLPLPQEYKAALSPTNFSFQASSNLEDSLQFPQAYKAAPSSTNLSSQASSKPQHQPSLQPSYKASPSQTRKRKFHVTTMPDSPLKLRVSWSGKHPLGLDGTRDNPSEWDALAGEGSDAGTEEAEESTPARRPGPGPSRAPTAWQAVASRFSIQAHFNRPAATTTTTTTQTETPPAPPQQEAEYETYCVSLLCSSFSPPY